MNTDKEIYFIKHCSKPECNTGTVEYHCPYCQRIVVDRRLWWSKDKIYEQPETLFRCSNCDKPLKALNDYTDTIRVEKRILTM